VDMVLNAILALLESAPSRDRSGRAHAV
jgi:hypothetical protein